MRICLQTEKFEWNLGLKGVSPREYLGCMLFAETVRIRSEAFVKQMRQTADRADAAFFRDLGERSVRLCKLAFRGFKTGAEQFIVVYPANGDLFGYGEVYRLACLEKTHGGIVGSGRMYRISP